MKIKSNPNLHVSEIKTCFSLFYTYYIKGFIKPKSQTILWHSIQLLTILAINTGISNPSLQSDGQSTAVWPPDELNVRQRRLLGVYM